MRITGRKQAACQLPGQGDAVVRGAAAGRFTELAGTAIANAEAIAEVTASRARIAGGADPARRQPNATRATDVSARQPRILARCGRENDNRLVNVSRSRVVLADDDILLREGLASLLQRSGLEVAGQAGDAAGLMELIREQRPGLAIVDIRMPPGFSTEGLDAAREIKRDFPETAVVVLSAHVEVEHAMDLLANGQRTGYLLKSRVSDVADFIETLRRVERGGSAVDPALVQELVAAQRVDDPLRRLTGREREVLALMAEGRSNAGIAQALWVTEGTVEKHVRSIMMKLQLPDTGEVHRRVLAVLAYLDALLASRRNPR
jgi:DNA-binding NarL/FixJ family response regulator